MQPLKKIIVYSSHCISYEIVAYEPITMYCLWIRATEIVCQKAD